jgi:DcrB
MATAAATTFEGTLKTPLPAEWDAKESVTLLAPDRQANVIMSSEPIGPEESGVSAERYARDQGDLLAREFPGYREHSFEPTTAFGRPGGFLRRFEWAPPDGVVVMQLQVYLFENGRRYTATATSPATEFTRYEREFRQVLDRAVIS